MQRQSLIATCLIVCAGVLGASGCGSKAASAPATAPAAPAAPAATPPAAPQSTPPATPPATPPPAAAGSNLDFVIVNSTGHAIKTVSVGASGTGNWAPEDEILKGRTFGNGDAMAVTFNPRATAEKWDIKVTWADGSGGEEWTNLNLAQIAQLTLVYDADNDQTSAIIE